MTASPVQMMSLLGKTALITGASRGIGRSCAEMLARHGALVNINYIQGYEAASETLSAITSLGGEARLVRFDVTSSGEVDSGVQDVVNQCGTIDILVNNAGICRDGLVGRMKDTDWDAVVFHNLTAAFYLCRAVARVMIRKRTGRIVNVSSTAGESGNAGQANYSASKAGLIGLTKSLARELAPRNILVNAVAPGIIAGGMTQSLDDRQLNAIRTHVPLGRLGQPNDVAAAVLFLCSGMSDYVTGQVIRVNGGLYM